MALLGKWFKRFSRQVPSVQAPRSQLLHAGVHPEVPFQLILEEHQSSYFYNPTQQPIKGIHQAGTYPQEPEHIPASRYVVINRELDEEMRWEVARVIEEHVVQLEILVVARVSDVERLSERFSSEENAHANNYISYRLNKMTQQCAQEPSLQDYQHSEPRLHAFFKQNLAAALADMGLELRDMVMTLAVRQRPRADAQKPTINTASIINRELFPEGGVRDKAQPVREMVGEEEQFYYLHLGTRHGPLPKSTLIHKIDTGELEPSTCVWKAGMGQWTPAHKHFLLNK
ncbi:MAG: DUF4339 domain-containing protein [Cardiobacteriaceae bacterium]|nr:DUF4339 domain-containing protein [Cardiobacteriaceae bacterium]